MVCATMLACRRRARQAGAACSRPQPTASHALLSELEEAGRVNFVASQKNDDLFREFLKAKLSELHGNIYTETCPGKRSHIGSFNFTPPPPGSALSSSIFTTRLDAEADLDIRARSDDGLGRVCKALGL